MSRHNYTNQEKTLLRACGVDDDRVFNKISPNQLYRSVAVDCFIHGRKGPHIHCLRKVMLDCFDLGILHRGTKEFEALLERGLGTGRCWV